MKLFGRCHCHLREALVNSLVFCLLQWRHKSRFRLIGWAEEKLLLLPLSHLLPVLLCFTDIKPAPAPPVLFPLFHEVFVFFAVDGTATLVVVVLVGAALRPCGRLHFSPPRHTEAPSTDCCSFMSADFLLTHHFGRARLGAQQVEQLLLVAGATRSTASPPGLVARAGLKNSQ